jgi:hypothetical protein
MLPATLSLRLALRRRFRLADDRAVLTDEVAIDFPSVSTLMARARETFLDEEHAPRTLAEDVVLTPAEASEGCELPVLVTQHRPCPACEGRGERWLEPCQRCAGRGERTTKQNVAVTIPPNVRHGEHLRIALDRGDVPVYVSIRSDVEPVRTGRA